MQEYHGAWLEQYRVEPAFLSQALENGFEIHHLDEDHGNNDPMNLVLIYGGDHRKLHGFCHTEYSHGRKTWREVLEDKRERFNKGERAYVLRKDGGKKWKDIALEIESDQPNTCALARTFAKANGLEWPIFCEK